MGLIYRSFGGLSLSFNSENDYVNATAIAKRYYEKTGKRRDISSWLKLQRTKETIKYISNIKQIPQKDLYIIAQGGRVPDEQGTFLHPDLVIPFAAWLSVEFEYIVTQIMLERISGQSRRRVEEELRELINTLKTYFYEAEEFGESIHTTSHRQMERIRAGIKLTEERLNELQSENWD